ATYSITNRPTPIAVLSNQPMFSMDQAKAAPDTAATDSGLRIPHSTKPTMREPVTPKIVLSSVNFRSLSSTPTHERRPGWMSWGYNPTASVARREKSLSRIVTSCSRGPSDPVGLSISILSPRDHSCYPVRELASRSPYGDVLRQTYYDPSEFDDEVRQPIS